MWKTDPFSDTTCGTSQGVFGITSGPKSPFTMIRGPTGPTTRSPTDKDAKQQRLVSLKRKSFKHGGGAGGVCRVPDIPNPSKDSLS